MLEKKEIPNLYEEIVEQLIHSLSQHEIFSQIDIQLFCDIAANHRLSEREVVKNVIAMDSVVKQ